MYVCMGLQCGNTALHIAVGYEMYDTVTLLLQRGADKYAFNKVRQHPYLSYIHTTMYLR